MVANKNQGASALFMLGLIIGGVIMALFTPRSGEEMRQKIKEKMDNVGKKAKDTADKVGEVAEEKLDQTKDVIEKGRSRLAPPNDQSSMKS